MANDGIGGVEDALARPVVRAQVDNMGTVEILVELTNDRMVGIAETIDRLLRITHGEERARLSILSPRQRLQQCMLRAIRILVLVDQHVPPARAVLVEHVGMTGEDAQRQEDAVVEVDRIMSLKLALVGTVKRSDV